MEYAGLVKGLNRISQPLHPKIENMVIGKSDDVNPGLSEYPHQSGIHPERARRPRTPDPGATGWRSSSSTVVCSSVSSRSGPRPSGGGSCTTGYSGAGLSRPGPTLISTVPHSGHNAPAARVARGTPSRTMSPFGPPSRLPAPPARTTPMICAMGLTPNRRESARIRFAGFRRDSCTGKARRAGISSNRRNPRWND